MFPPHESSTNKFVRNLKILPPGETCYLRKEDHYIATFSERNLPNTFLLRSINYFNIERLQHPRICIFCLHLKYFYRRKKLNIFDSFQHVREENGSNHSRWIYLSSNIKITTLNLSANYINFWHIINFLSNIAYLTAAKYSEF